MTQTTTDPRPTSSPAPRAPGRTVLVLALALAASLVVNGVLATVLLLGGGGAGGPAAEPSARSDEGGDAAEDPREVDRPAPELDDALLSFPPPELEDPETVDLSEDRSVKLDEDRDYVLELPDEPLVGGVSVSGGRNVVLVGGEITISPKEEEDDGVRGLFLKDQTGTVHVEGVAITGEGLGEGFNLDQRRGAVVQLQNVRVETVQGERDGHHADVIQTWAGPRELRIDRLSARSTYQGFFMLPGQFGDQDPPEVFDLRRVDIEGTEPSAYLVWGDKGEWPLQLTQVWLSRPDGSEDPQDLLWPRGDGEGTEAWDDVEIGVPPGGPFVPEGVAGVGYTSPGYVG